MGIHGFFQCMWKWYPEVVHHLPKREDIVGVDCPEDNVSDKAAAAAARQFKKLHDQHDVDADDYRAFKELLQKEQDKNGNKSYKAKGEDGEDDADDENAEGDEKKGGRRAKRHVRRYDNLYLDMNGLIHPCCHDTAPLPEPKSEEEMFQRVFNQMEVLFDYVRPRKCLFLAVDGVAPRSKMNQQRGRRFRAAQERLENDAVMEEVAEMMSEDYPQLPKPNFNQKWDHNVITPSTAFMERMSQAIEWFIHYKMNTDPRWRRILIVFSDSHVPGEGEHKIMHYIRGLRSQPGYDPTTSHCIHGQDADLICLALATHEPHFAILRNEVDDKFQTVNDRFCYFDITEYRERLRHDFSNIPRMDFERVLDDIVFLCFFVGNDFLPHVPMVHIKTEGLELLFDHYVRNFSDHYYLTKSGEINFKRLQKFLSGFQKHYMKRLVTKKARMHSNNDFATRRMNESIQEKNDQILHVMDALDKETVEKQDAADQLLKINAAIVRISDSCVAGKHPLQFEYGSNNYRDHYYRYKMGWEYQTAKDNEEEDAEREIAKAKAAVRKGKGGRDNRHQQQDDEDRKPRRVSRESYRLREVFESKVRRLAREYLRGMQWVMRYYTTGCPSWGWYYPYNYAPLLEDLIPSCSAEKLNTEMVLGEPLHPVEQLLAVLPRESVNALPEELHHAVTDSSSILGSFYPKDIDVDFTEAAQAYQGVIKLPFIDCDKLKEAVTTLIDLPPDDGSALLFVHRTNPLAREVQKLVESAVDPEQGGFMNERIFVPIPSHIQRYAPVAGRVGMYELAYPVGSTIECPDGGVAEDMADSYGAPIENNGVCGFTYELKTHADYRPVLLDGAVSSSEQHHRRGKKDAVMRAAKDHVNEQSDINTHSWNRGVDMGNIKSRKTKLFEAQQAGAKRKRDNEEEDENGNGEQPNGATEEPNEPVAAGGDDEDELAAKRKKQ